jgi:hypothetical protein
MKRWIRTASLVGVLSACAGSPHPVLEEEPPDNEMAPPAFTLSLPGDSTIDIVPNELFAIVVGVERSPDFEEPITFSALVPEGIVLIFRPTVVIRDETDILLVAETAVPVGRHTVTIRAEGSSGAVQTAPLLIDVAGPSS